MFQKFLFSLLIAGFSVTATAQNSEAFNAFVSTLDQALSFDEVMDHELLDIREEIEKRKAEDKPMQCKGLPGDQALQTLEQEVLYVSKEWLSNPERETMKTFFKADERFYICRDQTIAPKSEVFYQATLVFVINESTKEGLAFRVDWFDGDPIDEP